MAREQLPAEVHEHFRKANILHTYVEKNLGEARNHALETGQELMAAKGCIPHGRWEDECKRLFDGSPRTAQFYMAFARDFGKLKSAAKSALLMLEGTLDGAAKAAKAAANPKPPKPNPDEPIDVESEPVTVEEVDEVDEEPEEEEEPTKPTPKKPPKKLDKHALYKTWDQAIGPLMRTLDKIAEDVGEKNGASHKVILGQLDACTEEMEDWMGVK